MYQHYGKKCKVYTKERIPQKAWDKKNQKVKNQYSGDPTLPDQQIIDDIVRAEIEKVVTNENKEKEIEKTNKLAELGEND